MLDLNSNLTKKFEIILLFLRMSLTRIFNGFANSLKIFFLRRTLEFPAKKTCRHVWLPYAEKKQILQFHTSQTEHTDDLLSLNTEHTESSKIDHTETLLRPKRPYRIFLTFETNDNEQTEDTKAFLSLKRRIPKISYNFFAVFVRSSHLGLLPAQRSQWKRKIYRVCFHNTDRRVQSIKSKWRTKKFAKGCNFYGKR